MIELTEHQQKHEEAIKWLYFGGVRSGRTTLQAKIICDWLCENWKREFKIIDHHTSFNHNQELVRKVCFELTERGFDFKLAWNSSKISVTGKLQHLSKNYRDKDLPKECFE